MGYVKLLRSVLSSDQVRLFSLIHLDFSKRDLGRLSSAGVTLGDLCVPVTPRRLPHRDLPSHNLNWLVGMFRRNHALPWVSLNLNAKASTKSSSIPCTLPM